MKTNQKRREFLKKAGFGIAGIGTLPEILLNPLDSIIKKAKKVELAIATITMDGFGDQNFTKAFEILPQLPFKNIEFNCWYARTLTPVGISSIRNRCLELGLTPICVQGSSFGADGNIIKDVAHKLWNIHVAKELGCKRVKFTGAGRGNEGGLESVIACLREIVPMAEDFDIKILLENHVNNTIEFMEDYKRIFGEIDSPNVGICMDNGHFDASNVKLLDVVDKFHSKIMHIDLKDTERFGIHKIVNYGDGVTQNHAVVEKMLEYGYEGYLLIEMAPPRNEETLVKDLSRAYELFKRYQS